MRWRAVALGVGVVALVGVALGYRQLTDEPDVPELEPPAAAWPDDAELRDCSRVDSDVDDSGGMRGPAMFGDAIHQHRAWATYEPEALVAPVLDAVASSDWTVHAQGLLDDAVLTATSSPASEAEFDADVDTLVDGGVVAADIGVLEQAIGESHRGATVSLLLAGSGRLGTELAISHRPDGQHLLIACWPAEETGGEEFGAYTAMQGGSVDEVLGRMLSDPSTLDDMLSFHGLWVSPPTNVAAWSDLPVELRRLDEAVPLDFWPDLTLIDVRLRLPDGWRDGTALCTRLPNARGTCEPLNDDGPDDLTRTWLAPRDEPLILELLADADDPLSSMGEVGRVDPAMSGAGEVLIEPDARIEDLSDSIDALASLPPAERAGLLVVRLPS